jgi:hypothetical protein
MNALRTNPELSSVPTTWPLSFTEAAPPVSKPAVPSSTTVKADAATAAVDPSGTDPATAAIKRHITIRRRFTVIPPRPHWTWTSIPASWPAG